LIENLLAGLSISVSGIIITFMALGLFILVIVILQKLFPGTNGGDNGNGSSDPVLAIVEETPQVQVSTQSEEDEDLPVVIAAAISHFRAKAQSSLGTSLNEGKSGWWSSNRMSAKQGTGIRITRSGK
jgi:Na+-transporting methylmalonyl-CoA/oxaloacetate decarboxylase gamma subunit